VKALFVSFIIVILTLAAFGVDGPRESLENYYRYTKEKNLAGYFGVIDIETLSPNELKARKKATKLFWQQFDTLEYRIEDLTIKVDSDMAIVNYRLKTRITGSDEGGKIVDQATGNPMTAVLVPRNGGWKITNIGNAASFNSKLDIFSQHQPFGFRPADTPFGEKKGEVKPASDKSKI
jgi:hypothetical protein